MKILKTFFVFCAIGTIAAADAAPTLNVCTITSCIAGYYWNSGACARCPTYAKTPTANPSGASPAYNTSDVTSCYIPSGSGHSDETGSYEYTNNCNYTK